MFGSQFNRRMPNYQPYPHSKDIQTNTARLQFFSSLFNTNEITYLDPHKTYCIIQSERYNKIKEELSSSLKNQQSLQKTAYEMNLANIGLNQQIKIYRQQLDKLRNNQQRNRQQYEQASRVCKQYQRSLLQLKQQSKQRYLQHPYLQKDKSIASKTYRNQECQTELLLANEEQVHLVNEQSKSDSPPQVEVGEQKLYELVHSEMQKFQQEFQSKICELQDAKLNIGKWQAENTLLREENQHLKQKIVERDLQEEKLKIWRENIHEFVSKIQHSITHPSSKHSQKPLGEESNEQVHRLKEEVLELRGRIVEMRNKMKRVEDIMQVQGEINDDGAIGILVRTAQKFKQIVKGMIMEVEQI